MWYKISWTENEGAIEQRSEYRPVLVVFEGKTWYSPSNDMLRASGWMEHESNDVKRFTRDAGGAVTAIERAFLTTDKPAFVQQAEGLYLAYYRELYPEAQDSFTSAQFLQVQADIATRIGVDLMAGQPTSVWEARAFVMYQAFETIRVWWQDICGAEKFHPYPWGQTTNIVTANKD